jgi:serine protease Do
MKYKGLKIKSEMKYIIICSLGIAMIILGCKNQPSDIELRNKTKELELKERELDLLEKQLSLQSKENENIEEPKLSSLYLELKKSVFKLYAIDDDSNISQGSAFTIDRTGIALSNYHVFENASEVIAVNEEGQKFIINEILSFDKDLDYLAFRLGPNERSFEFLELSSKNSNIGEDCFAIGNPKGLTNTISRGIISSYRNDETLIQTDASFTHGSSGGPLFNSSGEVIGITSSGHKEADLNFALNIKSVPLSMLFEKSKKSTNQKSKLNVSTFNGKKYVAKYFDLVQSENFRETISLFSEDIERYYHKYQPEKAWVFEDMSSYRKKSKIKSVSIDIDFENLNVFESANGNYLIDFDMDYNIVRLEKNKPSSFKLKLYMEVNSDLEIVSLYENILSKK